MRRVISFVLAMVIVLWLPVRPADARARETSVPDSEGTAQTQQPARAADSTPRMVAGSAGTWQARLAHDALTSEIWSPRVPGFSLSASVLPARFRLHIAPPFRAFPLLI